MEVISSSSAWLSNYEVFRHLQDSKTTRGNGVKLPENILTVEFEVKEFRCVSSFITQIILYFMLYICRLLSTL